LLCPLTLCQEVKWVQKKGTNFLWAPAYSPEPPQSSGVLHLVLRDSFLRQPIRFKETFQQPTEVGQYQIVVQYQYQYFLKHHFQYQDQYQYCPWKTIKIKINIKTNIFSKCNIKINILKNLNSISIPASISSIYWYWYWKSIFHYAILTALEFFVTFGWNFWWKF